MSVVLTRNYTENHTHQIDFPKLVSLHLWPSVHSTLGCVDPHKSM